MLKSILATALVPEMGTDVGSKSADVKWGTPCSRQNDVFDFPGGYHFIMRFYVWGSFFLWKLYLLCNQQPVPQTCF